MTPDQPTAVPPPSQPDGLTAPRTVSPAAQQAFEAQARALGLDPANRWVGGYVDYEWVHLRPWLAAYQISVTGRDVLEFGSNVGASAIVLKALGARVQGVDVDAGLIKLARCNAARYGHDDITFAHVPDTRALPYANASFDLIGCNSVLEYVAPEHLRAVQQELARVLRPGGLLLITGTSSRLWPRETHSRQWFTNYLPRALDRLLPGQRRRTRGVWPWAIRYGFGPGYVNLDAMNPGPAFLTARANMQPRKDSWLHRAIAWGAARLGVGPGLLMNNLSCVLRKPG